MECWSLLQADLWQLLAVGSGQLGGALPWRVGGWLVAVSARMDY
jgi:hypothetical protein